MSVRTVDNQPSKVQNRYAHNNNIVINVEVGNTESVGLNDELPKTAEMAGNYTIG